MKTTTILFAALLALLSAGCAGRERVERFSVKSERVVRESVESGRVGCRLIECGRVERGVKKPDRTP